MNDGVHRWIEIRCLLKLIENISVLFCIPLLLWVCIIENAFLSPFLSKCPFTKNTWRLGHQKSCHPLVHFFSTVKAKQQFVLFSIRNKFYNQDVAFAVWPRVPLVLRMQMFLKYFEWNHMRNLDLLSSKAIMETISFWLLCVEESVGVQYSVIQFPCPI